VLAQVCFSNYPKSFLSQRLRAGARKTAARQIDRDEGKGLIMTRKVFWSGLLAMALAAGDGAVFAGGRDAREVWVTAQASSRVFVLKSDGALIETVSLPPGTGPHIVTFSPSGTFAYVAGMGSGKVLVLRADTRQVVSALDLGHAGTHQAKPAPDGSLLLVAQAHSGSLIKVAVNETAGTWGVVGKPLSFAAERKRPICTVFRDDGQRAYVSLLPHGLAVIDVPAMEVRAILPTDGFIACGMIKSRDGRTVTIAASGCGGHLYRLDTTTDTLTDGGALGAVDWHSFNLRGDGKVGFGTVPGGDELRIIDLEEPRARTLARLALDPTPGIGGQTVYVSLRKSGKLVIVDAHRRTVRYLDLVPPTTADIPVTCDTCVLHGVTVRR
jgi:hypothetical protein